MTQKQQDTRDGREFRTEVRSVVVGTLVSLQTGAGGTGGAAGGGIGMGDEFGGLVNWPTAIEGLFAPEQIIGVLVFLGFVIWVLGAVYVLLNENAGFALRLTALNR